MRDGSANDVAQLVVVGLHQERMERQDVHEKVALGVHHNVDAATVEAAHDALIDVGGQHRRHVPSNNEQVTGLKGVELGVERVDVLGRDLGAEAVNRRLLLSLCLHVDAAHALLHLDKVAGGTVGAHARLDLPAGEAGDKAQRRRRMPQVGEHNGDVDPLAPGQDLLVVHAVNLAQAKVIETNDVVERRVERYGVDHELLPTSTTLSAS